MKRTTETLKYFTNLLTETLAALTENGKAPDDVRWVGTDTHWTTWAGFAAIAENFLYDDGWGAACVNPALVVVGDGWWMERSEYDGNERWDFKSLPQRPEGPQTLLLADVGNPTANDK